MASAPAARPVVILSSGLNAPDVENLIVLSAVAPCTLVASYCPEVTHLVVQAKPATRPALALRRTLKYIQSVVGKVSIVRAEWITACLKANSLVPTDRFVITGAAQDAHPGGPERALRAQQPLLTGWCVALRGSFKFPAPPKPDVLDLLADLGAVVVEEGKLGACSPTSVVISDQEADARAGFLVGPAGVGKGAKASTPLVSFRWLLDCASCYQVLRFGL